MPFLICFLPYLIALAVGVVPTGKIFAQDELLSQQFQVPLTEDGISTRLEPQFSSRQTFQKTAVSFGVYREILLNPTNENYSSPHLGFSAGFEQNIRSIWSGGIELKWAEWALNSGANPNLKTLSPLSVFSKVSMAPLLPQFFGVKSRTIFRPYVTGGLGYTAFLDGRSFSGLNEKSGFGEVSLDYGIGLRTAVTPSFGFKLGYEVWRGIETNRYIAQAFLIQMIFGDVLHL